MKRNKYIYFILFVVLSYVQYGEAGVIDDPEIQQITISVSAESTFESAILNSIEKEVKKISDLEIANDKKQWVIDIIAARSGIKDVFLSVTIHEKLRNDVIIQATNPQAREMIKGLTSEVYSYEAHWIESGSVSNINKISEKIISRFDSEFLEKRRRSYEFLKKLMVPSRKQELGA